MKTGIKYPFIVSVLITVLGLILAGRVTAQTFTVLHSSTEFGDAGKPYGGLILSGNTLYGAAFGGIGNLFAVNTNGTGFTNLYTFTGTDGGGQGVLVLSGNQLYGAALFGGSS